MWVFLSVYHSGAAGSNVRGQQFEPKRDQVYRSQMIQGTGWHHILHHIGESRNITLKTQTQKHTYTVHTLSHTYHNGTVGSSCWWSLDPRPEFLHVNKLEWVQDMTHTLLRQKNTNNTFSFVAVIDGGAKDGDKADCQPHTKDFCF